MQQKLWWKKCASRDTALATRSSRPYQPMAQAGRRGCAVLANGRAQLRLCLRQAELHDGEGERCLMQQTMADEAHLLAAPPIGCIPALDTKAAAVRVPPDCAECPRCLRSRRKLMIGPVRLKPPTDTRGRAVRDPPCQVRPTGLRSPSDASQPSAPRLRPCGCRLIAWNALGASAVVDS